MKLTPEQLEQFDRDGYLFFPGLFTPRGNEDADRRRARARTAGARPTTCARKARTRCAPTSPRTCTASRSRGWRATRAWSSRCRSCSARQLYMHQFKINGKPAFDGDVWQWHQDYGTWQNDDLMPTERAMNVAIFLDDVNEYNGPLMFIPGSHKRGVVDARHDLTTTSYPLWTIDNALIEQLVERAGGKNGGIVSPQGPGRLDDPVPRLPGARVGIEPVALGPRQRLPEPVRGQQPHPPLQAPRVHRPPRLHADRDACPTTACCKDYPVELPWKNGMPASALETSTDELKIAA